jgi:O-succinylbenzoic acid--CoA ligase
MNFFGALSKYKIDKTKTALIFNDKCYSYNELFLKINSVSVALKKLGIEKNDNVALLSSNSDEFVIIIFALWNIGAVPIPINIRLLPEEILKLTDFTQCKFLLHDDFSIFSSKNQNMQIFSFADLFNADYYHSEHFHFHIDGKDIALILFTSGSTGNPKGVVITFNNFIRSAENGNQIFKHQEHERWLASLPFYHVGGFSIITRSFLYGATLIIPDGQGHEEIKNALYNFDPTQTSFVTTQLKRLLETQTKPNPSLKHVLLGGGFLENELVESAISYGWNVSKSYGATETTSFVTALSSSEFKNKPDSAGKSLIPNKIFIVDEEKKFLPSGSVGEVVIKSDSVAEGYFNNPKETSEKFINGLYFTGDFGWLDDEGYLFIEVRRNDLIISGGENISPLEVEKEIQKHPSIIEACVFGLKDDVWGHSVCAALITKQNSKITLTELNSFLADKLSSYKLPKKIFITDEFPKTELGKIQKEKLKEMLLK